MSCGVNSSRFVARGASALWNRAGRGQGIAVWQAIAFAIGLGSLALALLSPLAWLSDVLFSAHMTQHEILMLVSAPLLCLGRPLIATLWAAPPQWRERMGRWTHRPAVTATWRSLTAPLAVFLVHAVTLWLWHAPALYEAALRHGGVHALQHLSFVLTAALFWWGMCTAATDESGTASPCSTCSSLPSTAACLARCSRSPRRSGIPGMRQRREPGKSTRSTTSSSQDS